MISRPTREATLRPKKKEVFIRPDSMHKVYYRASQVERCLPCYAIEIKPKVRLAMLYPIHEFHSSLPEEKFYVGTVTEVSPGGMMTVEFDGNPYCVNITCDINHYSKYCIPAPAARAKKRRAK